MLLFVSIGDINEAYHLRSGYCMGSTKYIFIEILKTTYQAIRCCVLSAESAISSDKTLLYILMIHSFLALTMLGLGWD